MRIEDLKSWTVDQLKEELVRLADEREAKQHEILDKNDKINELQAELDKMCDYNNDLKRQISEKVDVPFYDESAEIVNVTDSIRTIALRLTSYIRHLMF